MTKSNEKRKVTSRTNERAVGRTTTNPNRSNKGVVKGDNINDSIVDTGTKVNYCSKLIHDYINKDNDKDTYDDTLITLSNIVAYSVLKKLANVCGYNERINQLRTSLTAYITTLEKMNNASNKAYRLTHNKDGELITVVNDKAAADYLDNYALEELHNADIGDGIDVANQASIAILEQIEYLTVHELPLSLEAPYTVRAVKRNVWIKDVDTQAYEDREVTAIQEVYRAVRRYIQEQGGIQSASQAYAYIDVEVEDIQSDTVQKVYRRLPRYADLGGNEVSSPFASVEDTVINHVDSVRGGNYTVDKQTVDDMDALIKSLNLTTRQNDIIALRLQGCGYKKIAKRLGVTPQAVKYHVDRMQLACVEHIYKRDGVVHLKILR